MATVTPLLVDSKGRFGYVPAIAWIYENFWALTSPNDVLTGLGEHVQDVSDSQEVSQLRAMVPLAPGFIEATFRYPDPIGRIATIELTWHGRTLANVRAMLMFGPPEILGRWMAKRYFRQRLLPTVRALPGLMSATPATMSYLKGGAPDVYDQPTVGVLESDELLLVARVVGGSPAVSTYLMNRSYV
jgi:hypothetical protein